MLVTVMIKVGDIFGCTITETDQWEAYGTVGAGQIVFINFSELSWERNREYHFSNSVSAGRCS